MPYGGAQAQYRRHRPTRRRSGAFIQRAPPDVARKGLGADKLRCTPDRSLKRSGRPSSENRRTVLAGSRSPAELRSPSSYLSSGAPVVDAAHPRSLSADAPSTHRRLVNAQHANMYASVYYDPFHPDLFHLPPGSSPYDFRHDPYLSLDTLSAFAPPGTIRSGPSSTFGVSLLAVKAVLRRWVLPLLPKLRLSSGSVERTPIVPI